MNYINPPFNYSGSKTKLLDQILPLFDYSKEYFIDLFCGGGSVYSNVLESYKKVLINDVIGDLIEIHKKLSTNPQVFIETVRNLAKTKENQKLYLDLKDSYNKEKTPEKLYALMLSCTNNAMRFNRSGKFNQSWGKREWNESTDKKVKEFVEHIAKYKDKIHYTSGHFSKVKPIKPNMIYIDPPYGYCVDEYGKITNKQVSEAGYNSFWYQKDDLELYNYMLELNKNSHSFMLSGVLEHDGKKSWIINKMIEDKFPYRELDFNYNGVSRKGEKKTTEVIIMNY